MQRKMTEEEKAVFRKELEGSNLAVFVGGMASYLFGELIEEYKNFEIFETFAKEHNITKGGMKSGACGCNSCRILYGLIKVLHSTRMMASSPMKHSDELEARIERFEEFSDYVLEFVEDDLEEDDKIVLDVFNPKNSKKGGNNRESVKDKAGLSADAADILSQLFGQ